MNKRYKKYLKRGILVLVSLYLLVCLLVSYFQEKLLFHPEVISKTESYSYDQEFIEKSYEVADGIELNTLLFQADSTSEKSKLVFYIHGNGENLTTTGDVSPSFTEHGYDCFVYDYRGYGKSDGEIDSEAGLFADAQILYSHMAAQYGEEQIVIVGYSIGSGIAAWLASKNSPNSLVLQAPYFSMKDMMGSKFPILPKFLLRYPLETNKRLKETKCPIYIFHGDKDEVIPYASSVMLKKEINAIDLTRLDGLGHAGFAENSTYQTKLGEILSH